MPSVSGYYKPPETGGPPLASYAVERKLRHCVNVERRVPS